MKSQMDASGIDENVITQNEAIILSMTKKERENPKVIDGSRKKGLLMVLEQMQPRSINCLSNLK